MTTSDDPFLYGDTPILQELIYADGLADLRWWWWTTRVNEHVNFLRWWNGDGETIPSEPGR